jgi:hypothetical protein
LDGLKKYENLKKSFPEQGLGFLKDKVARILNEYFEAANPVVIALVRNSLPQPLAEQVT